MIESKHLLDILPDLEAEYENAVEDCRRATNIDERGERWLELNQTRRDLLLAYQVRFLDAIHVRLELVADRMP